MCRASASPRLGLGVAGVVASALVISNSRSSGQRWGAGGVTTTEMPRRKAEEGGEVGDDRQGPPVSRVGAAGRSAGHWARRASWAAVVKCRRGRGKGAAGWAIWRGRNG